MRQALFLKIPDCIEVMTQTQLRLFFLRNSE